MDIDNQMENLIKKHKEKINKIQGKIDNAKNQKAKLIKQKNKLSQLIIRTEKNIIEDQTEIKLIDEKMAIVDAIIVNDPYFLDPQHINIINQIIASNIIIISSCRQ